MHWSTPQFAFRANTLFVLSCWVAGGTASTSPWKSIGDTLSKVGDVMGPIGDALGIISFLTELGEGSKGSISGTRLTIGVNREGDKDDDFVSHLSTFLRDAADVKEVRQNQSHLGIRCLQQHSRQLRHGYVAFLVPDWHAILTPTRNKA